MSGQLAAHADVALAGLQVVDGADVVQASAGDIVPRGGVGAGHHPGGAQGDGVDLADTPGEDHRTSVGGGGCGSVTPKCLTDDSRDFSEIFSTTDLLYTVGWLGSFPILFQLLHNS